MVQTDTPNDNLKVLMLGATGTAGGATTQALLNAGHTVTCIIRPGATKSLPDGAIPIEADVTDPSTLRNNIQGEHFDALVSCLASRTGHPRDAWTLDYKAHSDILNLVQQMGIPHMVLLSAICVQKPLLAFQQAKLAFEDELISSGLRYSIVRPTAFFKSLSGQIDRVRQGKPFLVFGDGTLTQFKPISDADLGIYIAECLTNKLRHNKILPIGGPGKALTPRAQGEMLFALTGQAPRFRQVPVALLNTIIAVLGLLGRANNKMADKAELAKIGRYYATESMLVLDPATGQYDADATPSTGTDTLQDFYIGVLDGTIKVDLGDHAVF